MAKHIIIAVTNDLETDQRVGKVVQTLIDIGFSITLVGRVLPESKVLNRSYPVKRFKLLFNKGALFYANYNIRLFFFLLFRKFDIVLSNDLDTLPASFIVAKLKRKTIVYDSHEYFTQVPELINRKLQQRFWEIVEKSIVPHLKYCYTVSPSIADEYNKLYNINFHVVRNLPEYKEKTTTPKENIIIYQGALNIGRGIELMIETIQHIDNYTLVIAGTGDIEKELKKIASKYNNSKVIFTGRLLPDQLAEITRKAQLGLSFEEDLGMSYRYALPNKLFDYIQARIPVLVSPLPEMKNIIAKYDVGEIIEKRNAISVAKQINNILNNQDKLLKWHDNLDIAAKELNWNREKDVLLKVFNSLSE